MSRSTWDTSRLSSGFRIRGFHPLWPDFPDRSAILQMPYRGPATPSGKPDGLGCSAFARHYLRNHCCFLFLRVLRCFTSPGVALKPYVFRLAVSRHYRDGFPHSEISGSKRVCRSPKLIAAYHVLHRLLMPRHPSCALMQLDQKILVILFVSTLGEELHLPSLCNCQRTTPALARTMVQSNQPDRLDVRPHPASALTDRSTDWWACLESNQGPRPYQGRALTN